MGINEETTIACDVAYPQLFEAAHQALAELGASIESADPTTGVIRAKKSMGMAMHPDPSGRHEHRWFDGQQWTDTVSDAGVTASDPL